MKKNILTCISVCIMSALLITGCASETDTIGEYAQNDNKNTSQETSETKQETPSAAKQETPSAAKQDGGYNPAPLEEGKVYYADIDIKDYGKITVKLDQSAAPVTCANFVQLANEGFYNGLTFHRIIDGFMMQGGDPEGTGMGGSENEIVGEFAMNGHDNPISHKRGIISMARSQNPDSASSQFFIVHEDSTFLDGQYAGFGEVIEGIEVVDAVCTAAEPTDGNGTIPAENQPVINTIVIRVE